MQPIRVWKRLAIFLTVLGSCLCVHYLAVGVNASKKVSNTDSWQDPYIVETPRSPDPSVVAEVLPEPPKEPVLQPKSRTPPQNMAQQNQMLEREQRRMGRINEKLQRIEKQLKDDQKKRTPTRPQIPSGG